MQHMISKNYKWEAAHVIPKHPGKCSSLHGHSYGMTVWVKTHVLDDLDFVVDFGDLSELVKSEIIEMIDHTYIHAVNDPDQAMDELQAFCETNGMRVYPLHKRQSSAENMACHFAEIIAECAHLYFGKTRTHDLQFKVAVRETASSEATTGWITGAGDWLV